MWVSISGVASNGASCEFHEMESKVERYHFRVVWRNETHEMFGRIVQGEDGRYKTQLRASSPQNANILIEVAPLDDREALWPLLRKAAVHRGMQLIEYRPTPHLGAAWEPVPGA